VSAHVIIGGGSGLSRTLLQQPINALPALLPAPTLAPGRHFDLRVTPPGSKSLANRAILLAALARGTSRLGGVPEGADDVERMLAAVEALGARTRRLDGVIEIDGVTGRWPAKGEVTLDLGDSGTCARFLAAAAMFAGVPIVLDGSARLRERPIGPLAGALEQIGCRLESLGASGGLPLRVHPRPAGKPLDGVLEFSSAQSSQFITALLLCGAFIPGGMTIRLSGEVTSASYVAMTLGLLGNLGATVKTSDNLRVLRVAPTESVQGVGIPAFESTIEPDASGATYFWAAAAVTPGATCEIEGLDDHSLQGDAAFPGVLGRMGAVLGRAADGAISVKGPPHLRPILADMSDMPDAAVTLACVACFAQGTSIIRGLRTLRVKECDRIAALVAELSKIGVRVENPVNGDPDTITITPPHAGPDCTPQAPPVTFETYNDHRMAMALALIGLRRPHVTIRNPACVAKTYPAFWTHWARLFE
jgi:3-phosphoshikimate 1-carboxyvinyltransferase